MTKCAAVIFVAACWGAAQTPGKNLALNRPAIGSTPCNEDENPSKAVNGSVTGGTGDKWCSSDETKWLQVDLGGNYRVDRVIVRHASAGGENEAWNTRAFKIHVSTDGRNFTAVANVNDNTAGVTTHKIDPIPARYVQLEVLVATQDGDPAARIYEFEVYGEPAK